ncbi:MAG: BtrH N-terminal domain-containing protein [Bacillota bacterium]|nr:BtrH N-terminal domain-containing protein [Bacillota bacterium]
MVIKDFKEYKGQHCESTATGCLLKHAGIEMSEPMMLGLGESFGFIYWKMSIMNLPFIGGRSKPFDLTRILCRNLNITLDARETESKKKAWSNITEFVDQNIPVALQLDCYHLEHFKRSFHFAGHFVCIYGYNNTYAYIVDTGSTYKTALANLENARFEKGPMAAKARSWTLQVNEKLPDFKNVIPIAVKKVATEFLNPPLKCFGYKGIHKLGSEIVKWIEMTSNPEEDIIGMAEIMEKGGTGGALFRNLYRDFLKECLLHLPHNQNIERAYELYKVAASNWTQIAALIYKAGNTCERVHLEKASILCNETAEVEKSAMELLSTIIPA